MPVAHLDSLWAKAINPRDQNWGLLSPNHAFGRSAVFVITSFATQHSYSGVSWLLDGYIVTGRYDIRGDTLWP